MPLHLKLVATSYTPYEREILIHLIRSRHMAQCVLIESLIYLNVTKSCAVTRKPCDAVAVCFALKFADIHHKCKSGQT